MVAPTAARHPQAVEAVSRHVTRMEIYDAGHYTPAEIAEKIAAWPEHERDARALGVPMLGAGAVFPLSKRHLDEMRIERLERIPHYWYRIGALDFGWEHPTAAVELHWDKDNDIVYVTRSYRVPKTPPEEHAVVLRAWGKNLRWAWPHDGLQETAAGKGLALRDQYRAAGLRMLDEHAHYETIVPAGGKDRVIKDTSVEAGVMDMLDRMRTGRLKVPREHSEWWDEFFAYHRDPKTGQVVKLMDDLLSATRYGIMMLRHARQPKLRREPVKPRGKRNFDT